MSFYENMVNVIVIRNSVVDENYIFCDEDEAERFFVDKIIEMQGHGVFIDGEIEQYIEDGHYISNTPTYGNSVCISKPT